MEKPAISIIVPTYNVVSYLGKCVDSICQQTYTDIEIIIVDDGSTDGCSELADNLAKKDERIRVIHKKNGGLSSARNAGLDNARGDYLMFIDSDDYIEEKMCELLVTKAVSNKSEIVECGHRKVYIDRVVEERPTNHEVVLGGRVASKAYIERSLPIQSSVCVALYHKSIFENLRFKEGRLHEDGWFKWQALYTAHKVTLVPDCLYNYVQAREGSIMTVRLREKNVVDVLDSFEYRWHFFEQAKDEELAELSKYVYVRNLLSYYYLIQSAVEDKQVVRRLMYNLRDKLYEHRKFILNTDYSKGKRKKFLFFYYLRPFTNFFVFLRSHLN